MTKRALRIIQTTYGDNCPPAIAALVEFAAQNSGIDARNYYNPTDLRMGNRQAWRDGMSAYRQECRSISADLKRFKEALNLAACEGVTDKEVIAAAPGAYSGRLEWVCDNCLNANCTCGKGEARHWGYTTGQYFPTEYRKAAATVLEYAIREVRQNRPPEKRVVTTITELRALNEKNGGCWFDRGSMRFFGTRIESGIIRGKYFITSEQPPHGSRAYSVRSFDDEGSVDTVGDFCAYGSKAEALAAIPRS